MTVGTPDHHLFVFWRWPEDGCERLVDQFRQAGLDIDRVVRLRWSRERMLANFQRFHASRARRAFRRYADTDRPFLLVLATDASSDYQYRLTDGLLRKVNRKSFDLAQRLSGQRGTALHATLMPREFRRDLMLLTGERAADFRPPAGAWDGGVEELDRDLVGAEGWSSLSETFAVLNEAVEYVVLRNFENLPESHVHGSHGDIDLLVDSVEAKQRVLAILDIRQSGHALVGGRKVYFDLRTIDDFYYDPEWCRRILSDRVMVRGFYAPNQRDYFFSLLYHGHVQKPKMAKDYVPRLMAMAPQIGLDWITPEMLTEPAAAARLLGAFLKANGFHLTRPNGCPQYNPSFVARISDAPFLFRSDGNFYQHIAAAQSAGHGEAALLDQVRNFEANGMSRKWLLRMLAHRLGEFPADLWRRVR